MDPVDKGTQLLRDTLKVCFEQIRFARAAELARSQRYLEAEGLLTPNGRESSDPKELDLLARISAQQRQYGRARCRWEAALQQSPGNADYARAIERAKEAEHFQAMMRKSTNIGLLTLAVVALAIATWKLFPMRSPTGASDVKKQQNVHGKATPLPSSQPSPQATQLPSSESQQPILPKPALPSQSDSESLPITPPVPIPPQPDPPLPEPAPPQPVPPAPPPVPPPATPQPDTPEPVPPADAPPSQ